MSKKTKRLEKENQNLTRRHETTNHNILQMAEERTKVNKELDMLRRKNENLEKLCRGMQAQGRGSAAAAAMVAPPSSAGVGAGVATSAGEYDEGDVTESEYEYGDEELSEEFDDDDADVAGGPGAPVYGPVPPPPQSVKANGPPLPPAVAAQANGVRH